MDFAREGRILYLSSVDVSRPIGPAVNEREFLISAYHTFGDRVHAIIPRPRRDCPDIDPSRTSLHTDANTFDPLGLVKQQVEVHRLAKRAIASFQPDLVVARVGVLPLALRWLTNEGVPIYLKTVSDPFGFAVNNRGVKGMVGKCLVPFQRRVMRQLIRSACAADACTPEIKQLVCRTLDCPQDKIAVVQNATNVHRFQPSDKAVARGRLGWSQFSPILGYIGGSPEKRGGMELLELARRLLPDYPNLAVAIIGKQRSELLRQRASELKLGKHAIMPGEVPYESVPQHMNALDIGFATGNVEWSARVGNSYQKVRQYLACGKPIITCGSAGSELIESGLAELVSPGDVGAMESATRKVLSRSEREQSTARQHAVQTAHMQYSTEATLRQRIDRWNLFAARGQTERKAAA